MTLTTVTLLERLMPMFLIPFTFDLLMTALTKHFRSRLQQFGLFPAMRRVAGTAVTRNKRPMLAVQTELFHNIFMTGTAQAPL